MRLSVDFVLTAGVSTFRESTDKLYRVMDILDMFRCPSYSVLRQK